MDFSPQINSDFAGDPGDPDAPRPDNTAPARGQKNARVKPPDSTMKNNTETLPTRRCQLPPHRVAPQLPLIILQVHQEGVSET
jgi:hypothetical protein